MTMTGRNAGPEILEIRLAAGMKAVRLDVLKGNLPAERLKAIEKTLQNRVQAFLSFPDHG